MANSMSREQKRMKARRLRKIVLGLFALCAIMLVADIVCGIILIAKSSKSKDSDKEESIITTTVSTVDPSASDASADPTGDSTLDTTPTSETSATPSGVEVKEYLPENALAEQYWGPLPAVSEVKPVQHNEVHGIYVGAAAHMDDNIALAQRTDINAFVLDLKDEAGGIMFNSNNEFAKDMKLYSYSRNKDTGEDSWKELGSYITSSYDLDAVVKRCHENNIKVIGRIVCFNDISLAKNHPEMSIKDANGNPMHFKLEGYKMFVNPYDPEVWNFLIDIANEAIAHGVDEIQFDYVRFPTISTKSGESPYFGPEDTTPTRIDAINRFLQTARRKIQDPTGIPVTADVFGIILSSELDGKLIGQGWNTVGLTGVDAVCPMLYPSHYADNTSLNGQLFDHPDLYPHDVMYNALMCGKSASEQEGYATVRPYVQAFTATYIKHHLNYKDPEVNAQIQAIEEAGYDEWILWQSAGDYTNRYGTT